MTRRPLPPSRVLPENHSMTNTSLFLVVVSADPSLRLPSKSQECEEIVQVGDISALVQVAREKPIDGVVLGEGVQMEDLGVLGANLDLSKTVVMAGPLSVADAVVAIRGLLGEGKAAKQSPGLQNVTLEDFVESKFGEFVKAMKASSSRSLYATLIRAVERPLIELALRETHGNQIQAAQLLGLNRNTLRKKISECKISIKKRSQVHREKESS